MAYPLDVELRQPAQDPFGAALPDVVHEVGGRWLGPATGGRGPVDDSEAQIQRRRISLLYAPAGIGSRWRVTVDGVSWNIESADYPPNRNRAVLVLQATSSRGLINVAHPDTGFSAGFSLGFR
ncbi:MAG: hypothetical protein OXH75_15660 [Acidobacteria bacterium]|nr:hypothetical protein [Acidobacteriota bacterium]